MGLDPAGGKKVSSTARFRFLRILLIDSRSPISPIKAGTFERLPVFLQT
jgi:hypothetical protein